MKHFGLSQRRACALVNISRSVMSYQPKKSELNEKLRRRLIELAQRHRRWGHWRFYVLIRREGVKVNHKRTERIYRQEKLMLKIRRRKKVAALTRIPLPKPEGPNQRWAMDFVHDQLSSGRRLRALTVVDTFTKECLAIEVDTSLNGMRVKRVVEALSWHRGLPAAISVDNGPEFAGKVLDEWAYRRQVKLAFIRPGKPVENAFIESFNGKFREECLNLNYFVSLDEAKQIIEDWRIEYNGVRPHRSLNDLTPEQFIKKLKQPNTPNTYLNLA